MAELLVILFEILVARSNTYISELPISGSDYDITIFLPSGEKRGAKVMPGNSPTIS